MFTLYRASCFKLDYLVLNRLLQACLPCAGQPSCFTVCPLQGSQLQVCLFCTGQLPYCTGSNLLHCLSITGQPVSTMCILYRLATFWYRAAYSSVCPLQGSQHQACLVAQVSYLPVQGSLLQCLSITGQPASSMFILYRFATFPYRAVRFTVCPLHGSQLQVCSVLNLVHSINHWSLEDVF